MSEGFLRCRSILGSFSRLKAGISHDPGHVVGDGQRLV